MDIRQLNQEEALSLAESKFWEGMTFRQLAEFQLTQDRLCMPFAVFHEAVTKALGRSVWTHEFANPKALLKELRGEVFKCH